MPSLGPATFEGDRAPCRLGACDAHLDVPGFDSGRGPARAHPAADVPPAGRRRRRRSSSRCIAVAGVAVRGTSAGPCTLEPMPLCIGAPFRGTGSMLGRRRTASSRRSAWSCGSRPRRRSAAVVEEDDHAVGTRPLAGEGEFGGEAGAFDFSGTLPDRCLPTVEGPHDRSSDAFRRRHRDGLGGAIRTLRPRRRDLLDDRALGRRGSASRPLTSRSARSER